MSQLPEITQWEKDARPFDCSMKNIEASRLAPKTLYTVTDCVITGLYAPPVITITFGNWTIGMLIAIRKIADRYLHAYEAGVINEQVTTDMTDRIERAMNWLINRGTVI